MNVVRNARVAAFGLLLALPAGAKLQAQQAPRHYTTPRGAAVRVVPGRALDRRARANAAPRARARHHRNRKAARRG